MSVLKTIKKYAPIVFTLALVSAKADAKVYPKGTFTLTPVNMNLASFYTGFGNQDHLYFNETATGTVSNSIDLFRAKFSAGFHESDRNGTGYALEASYFVQNGLAVLMRAGISHERGLDDVNVVQRALYVDSRTNFGGALGLRKFLDCGEKWRPFIAAIAGITFQDKVSATIRSTDPNSFTTINAPITGQGTFINKKTLYSLELNVGTEYLLTERCAVRFETGVRYSSRAGRGQAITTSSPFGPDRSVSIRGNRNRFTFPVNFAISFIF